MKPTDIALALTVPVLWGFGFTLAKPAVAHFPPLLLMAMTYAVTGLCLRRRIRDVKTPMATVAVLALFVATIQGGLLFYGLAQLPASTAVLILQSSVPFSVLFAWALAGEKPTPMRLLGMGLSFVGIVIIVGGLWVAVSTWRARLPKMHMVSLLIVLIGLVLVATEILPRVGYAAVDPKRPPHFACAEMPDAPLRTTAVEQRVESATSSIEARWKSRKEELARQFRPQRDALARLERPELLSQRAPGSPRD